MRSNLSDKNIQKKEVEAEKNERSDEKKVSDEYNAEKQNEIRKNSNRRSQNVQDEAEKKMLLDKNLTETIGMVSNNPLCFFCEQNRPNIFLQNCFHGGICKQCMFKNLGITNECPICKKVEICYHYRMWIILWYMIGFQVRRTLKYQKSTSLM